MLLLATTDWYIKIPWSVVWAVLVAFSVALIVLVLFLRRQDRQRKLARQSKAVSSARG